MSYDFKLQNKCDHVVNWERIYLQPDQITIYLTRTIAAVSSLQLRMNNAIIDQSEYSILKQVTVKVIEPPFYIQMNKRVPLYDPLVEARYTTVQNKCPKCMGVNTLDDLSFSREGDAKTTNKESLLIQSVEKSIVTRIDSNIFHAWYGSGLQNLVQTKITDAQILRSRIVDQINEALNRLKAIQQQLVSSGRKVDPGELFGSLLGVDIQQTEDPSMILVTVSFTAQSGKTLDYSQYLEFQNIRERLAFK